MLFYKLLKELEGHPTLCTDEYTGEWKKIARDLVRVEMWDASLAGDRVARAALIDWYQEHGIYERKTE